MEIHFCPPVKDMPVHPALTWAFLVPPRSGRAHSTDPLSADWGCRCCCQPIGDRDTSIWPKKFGDGFPPWLRDHNTADYCDLCLADFYSVMFD
jgi:hypothetical protein